jgi:hypothetical protein
MITSTFVSNALKADKDCMCRLGNTLFNIAGIIGIAEKNGYKWGFHQWANQEFFKNLLPKCTGSFEKLIIKPNYKGFDIGFMGFYVPDNIDLKGQFDSEKYWKHCEKKVRHYLTMKPLCDPVKDTIIIQYRAYNELKNPLFTKLTYENYYKKALSRMPKKPVLCITDDPKKAARAIGVPCDYVHYSPIIDFYLLTQADYIIMANSTFSWWGAYLSQAKTVAPKNWFWKDWSDAPLQDLYPKEWEVI